MLRSGPGAQKALLPTLVDNFLVVTIETLHLLHDEVAPAQRRSVEIWTDLRRIGTPAIPYPHTYKACLAVPKQQQLGWFGVGGAVCPLALRQDAAHRLRGALDRLCVLLP
jgi:hypothetical protein